MKKKNIVKTVFAGVLSTCLIGTFLVTSVFAAPTNLGIGATGNEVTAVQEKLVELGFLNDKADGSFGPNTEAAVTAFQTANGLEATGNIDEATYNELFANSGAFRFDLNENKDLNKSYMLRMFVNQEGFVPSDGALEILNTEGATVYKTELTDSKMVATVAMSEKDLKNAGWTVGTEINVFIPSVNIAEKDTLKVAFNTGDATVNEQVELATVEDNLFIVQAENVDSMREGNTVQVTYHAPENTAKAEFTVDKEDVLSVSENASEDGSTQLTLTLAKEGQATLSGIFCDADGNTLKEENVVINVYGKKNVAQDVANKDTKEADADKKDVSTPKNNKEGYGAGAETYVPTYAVTDFYAVEYCAEPVGVNVRTNPSLSGKVIGAYQFGDTATITGIVTADGANTGWYRVNYNGQEAYVYGSWFTAEQPQYVKPTPCEPTKQKEDVSEKPQGEETPEKPQGEETPEKPQGEETPEKPQGEEQSSDVVHVHTYKEIDMKEPRCDADGFRVMRCTECGDTYNEPIPATGHDFQPTTETVYHDAETHEVEHPAETHTETIHHDATSEDVWVVDKEAYDEEVQDGTKTVVDKEAWTETVVDKEAWTETVVDKEAWSETVVDKEAWDEQVPVTKTIYVVSNKCQECNEIITGEGATLREASENFGTLWFEHADHADEAGYWELEYGPKEVPTGEYTTVHHDAETHVVEHPAETHEVNHPAETHEVNHPAETHEEPVYKIVHHDEEGHYETKTTPAWDEEVEIVDKEAWTETVVDKEAWTEEVTVNKCTRCGHKAE